LEIISNYFSDFTPHQLDQLKALGALYPTWNEKINVISRKDIDQLYIRHILHSLSIATICNFEDGAQIIDIGTGGGFPGIPLAIVFPNVQFLLVDSIGKKITVVQEIAQAIGLKNVTAIHSRAEQIKNRTFDFAVSRAVAPLLDLWTWAAPLLKKGHASDTLANGLICLKGGDLSEEIAVSKLRPHYWDLHTIFPEPLFQDKCILYVKK
jgi:16S rRNA (guanine527-N7)-methyltransferase